MATHPRSCDPVAGRRRRAAALGAALAAAAVTTVHGRAQAAPAPTDGPARIADGDVAAAARIADVLQRARPTPREQAWRRIPWRESLTKALAEARRDRKPVYVHLSDGWFPTGSC